MQDSVQAHSKCCVTLRCREGRCRFSVNPPAGSSTIGGTMYQRSHGWTSALCDCMVFWSSEQERVAAVELKGGGVDLSEVQRQLQGGAEVVERILGERAAVSFYPVLVHCGIKTVELRQLGRLQILFRAKKYSIVPVRSPAVFNDVVARLPK